MTILFDTTVLPDDPDWLESGGHICIRSIFILQANHLHGDMDINCGSALDGDDTVEEMGRKGFQAILSTAFWRRFLRAAPKINFLKEVS